MTHSTHCHNVICDGCDISQFDGDRDLNKQLTDINDKQFSKENEVITVHRGQLMTLTEFQNIRDNEGKIISVNSYFSASISSEVAFSYTGYNGDNRPFLVSVLFTIELHARIGVKPFANAKMHSMMTDEDEILISYGTIFKIQSVEEYPSVWNVTLIMSEEMPPWATAIDELPHCCFESFFDPLIYGCEPTVDEDIYDSDKVASLLEAFRRRKAQERQAVLQSRLKKALGSNYGRTQIRTRKIFLKSRPGRTIRR
ncbi:unnamed protein product [Didymodactylos carnosus]|uniref:NAD(P)(+)--arginine ADP-ribosyltransferase n=1 Tax=Didymodactylos carnosus TaxID=1234261 RepID=A0A814S1Q3_9BILA|nr:unnamed protein product [Didymodactylos carnosus]CAF1141348.1 unnamed protein product [Didymodactylos carnosus]CAF3625697.1 unnamed protein product [Didymodactylos carnosus]CAF3905058.1 unnamed protein product [Didymodactylos carnosus]